MGSGVPFSASTLKPYPPSGLGERKLPPLLQDGVRFVVPVQERVVDDVVDPAGGQAADVCLDLLAVDRFTIRRSGAAVTDGSTGIGMGPVRSLLAVAVAVT